MTPAEKVARAQEAEILLKNETLQQARLEIETAILKLIARPPQRNSPEEREWNYMMLQAQNAFFKALDQFVREGHFELVTLELQQSAPKARTNGGRGTRPS